MGKGGATENTAGRERDISSRCAEFYAGRMAEDEKEGKKKQGMGGLGKGIEATAEESMRYKPREPITSERQTCSDCGRCFAHAS